MNIDTIKKYKIACVVVTYNRKNLLIQCLTAIGMQAFQPDSVYIIDNNSTDGTKDVLLQKGFCNNVRNNINYIYVGLEENIGGAGGFYTGMKMAFESTGNYDAIWVMDDDGIPDCNQLERLVINLNKYDYISPLVLDKDDHTHMAFGNLSLKDVANIAVDGVMKGRANPFNGILYSRKLIETIGYPEKDMFIWGDEWQYHLRAKKVGFQPVTIIDALHYHPKDRQKIVVTRGEKKIVFPEQDWKLYCLCRNKVFYQYVDHSFCYVLRFAYILLMDYYYYFYKNEIPVSKFVTVFSAVKDGLFCNLKRLNRYR